MSVRILRSTSLLTSTTTPTLSALHHHQTRTFLSNLPNPAPPQHLTAHRTLPYPSMAIYDIIADIPSYPSFLPFCSSAAITSWSKPDAHYSRKWPQQASMTVGFGDRITESFVSRVYCLPPVAEEKGRAGVGYVEAVSGRGVTGGEGGEGVEHHDHEKEGRGTEEAGEGPMEMLRTKWAVKSFPYKHGEGEGEGEGDGKEMTDVTLTIEYKFKNLAYDMMSRAMAPKMADKMIEAFEQRVKAVLDKR